MTRLTWGQLYPTSLSVADQGVVAGGALATNILLARWLPVSGYGGFAIAYAVVVLVGNLHNALINEPMLVLAATSEPDQQSRYFSSLFRMQLTLTTVAIGALLAATAIALLFGPTPAAIVGGAAFAVPFVLLHWMLRRVMYVLDSPGSALTADLIYGAATIFGVWGLRTAEMLSLLTALAVIGLAAFLASLLLWLRIPARAPFNRKYHDVVRADHWAYGQWALGSAVLLWLPLNAYYFLLPIWHGAEASAAFRALQNVTNPMLQVFAAVSLQLTPLLARLRNADNEKLHRTARTAGMAAALGGTAYFIAAAAADSELLELLYRGRYQEYSGLPLLLAAAVVVPAGWQMASAAALRAKRAPSRIFQAQLVGITTGTLLGAALTPILAVVGALIGVVAPYILSAALIAVANRNVP